jgi:glutamyl-tRNA reductase
MTPTGSLSIDSAKRYWIMHDIVLVGLNHKTAPVELRECLAFSADEAQSALEALGQYPDIGERLVLSTCNRVEVIVTAQDPDRGVAAVKKFLSGFKHMAPDRFQDSLYTYLGDEAVRHLFRVAASLDSMMVGEPQILGQIKNAYRIATGKNTSGVILNRLLHRTFFVAKRVRTETGIGDHAVSISYAAIELGRKIFGTLDGKKVLLIGAGEMAELAVEHLMRNRVGDVFVANRTFARAVDLARGFRGTAVAFEEIPGLLQSVDIIISSTGAPGFVIGPDHVKGVMKSRRHRPLFFIDIAVPRDIDPGINRMDNAYVYDIDDLKGVIDDNIEDRRLEALKGERIIDEAVLRFRQWYHSLEVVPTIVALRKKIEGIVGAETEKTLASGHFAASECDAIRRMTQAMVNKILHDPTLFLKGDGCHGSKSLYLDVTRSLFRLEE